MKPVPDNVKEVLTQLSGPHQVAIRSYIATLRSEIKQLEEDALNAQNSDPHAHYHGHEKCTADHGHAEHKHTKTKDNHEHGHEHSAACEHHDHKHHNEGEHHNEHGHNDHGHNDHGHKHHHDAAPCEHDHDHHEHKHAHKEEEDHHDHKHAHGHKKDDMPEWKKQALNADPSAAPFGGSWNTESNVSATDAAMKMEE